jgi:hypothetical protein
MPGYFYPAPPAFIGGRQPYAPRLGQPPGSPGDRQTRTYVTLAIIMAAWTPPAFHYLPPQTRIAPFLTPPGPPPPTNSAQLLSIIRQWDPRPFYLPEPVEIASQSPAPAAPSQPPPPSATIWTIRSAWEPATLPLPRAPQTPQAAPSQPPPLSAAIWTTIRNAWEPTPSPLPRAARIAPIPPAPDLAPPRALSTPQVIAQAWAPALYYWLPPQTRIAALLPSFSAIPPTRVNAAPAAISAWSGPSYTLPPQTRIAALLQVAPGPPPRSASTFAIINAAWAPAPYALPELANFAALIPPASTAPPPRSRAVLEWIRKLWDPQPFPIPRTAAPPRWTPILEGGPRYIVKQPETRAFAIEQDAKRAFIVAQFEPRVYTITSGDHMGFRFSIKEPHELIPLTFDFSPDLLSVRRSRTRRAYPSRSCAARIRRRARS